MTTSDLSKIIAGFLLLATATAGSALLISSIHSSASPTFAESPMGTPQPGANEEGGSAFVEPLPDDTPLLALPDRPSEFAFNDPNNVTDKVTRVFVSKLTEVNPGGPTDDGTGEKQLAIPADFNEQVIASLESLPIDVYTPRVDTARFKMMKAFDFGDADAYFASVKGILDETYGDSGFKALAARNDPPTETAFAAVNLLFSQAEEKLYRLPVPEPLQELHKRFIAFVATHKAATDSEFRKDPLKTLAYIDNFRDLNDIRVAEIDAEVARLLAHPPSTAKPAAFWKTLFGAREAHAQWPVFDLPHTTIGGINAAANTGHSVAGIMGAAANSGNFLHNLWMYAKQVILEIVKDQLVHRMVYQTITWAQNGFKGSPQFVQNWKGFLSQAGNDAAGMFIQGIAPGVCKPFGPLLKVQLYQITNVNPPKPVQCTLNRIVANIEDFYKSFETGGWIAYSYAILPSNNYYGALFEGSQVAQLNKAAVQSAKAQEAQTNQGYRSKQQCVKFAEPVNIEWAPATADNNATLATLPVSNNNAALAVLTPQIGIGKGGCTKDASVRQEIEKAKQNKNFVSDSDTPSRCMTTIIYCEADGGFETVTPGGLVASQVHKAMGSTFDKVISAQDIAALFSAFVNSALNKLISAGMKGLATLASGGAEETAGESVGSAPNNPGDNVEDIDTCRGFADIIGPVSYREVPRIKDGKAVLDENGDQIKDFVEVADVIKSKEVQEAECRKIKGTTKTSQSHDAKADKDTLSKMIRERIQKLVEIVAKDRVYAAIMDPDPEKVPPYPGIIGTKNDPLNIPTLYSEKITCVDAGQLANCPPGTQPYPYGGEPTSCYYRVKEAAKDDPAGDACRIATITEGPNKGPGYYEQAGWIGEDQFNCQKAPGILSPGNPNGFTEKEIAFLRSRANKDQAMATLGDTLSRVDLSVAARDRIAQLAGDPSTFENAERGAQWTPAVAGISDSSSTYRELSQDNATNYVVWDELRRIGILDPDSTKRATAVAASDGTGILAKYDALKTQIDMITISKDSQADNTESVAKVQKKFQDYETQFGDILSSNAASRLETLKTLMNALNDNLKPVDPSTGNDLPRCNKLLPGVQ